jgi:uncharacterized membrane protein YedE/YeeE
MMVVVMMRCALDVVMVMYWLTRAILRETILSPIEWSGCVRRGNIILGFVMVVVVVMVTSMLLARTETTGFVKNLLVMWCMVMVMSMLVALGTTNARGCATPVLNVSVKHILVFDSLRFPALLRIHALQSHYISRFKILRE